MLQQLGIRKFYANQKTEGKHPLGFFVLDINFHR
jgi:hypothetical protein